jgi:hypothetical protein
MDLDIRTLTETPVEDVGRPDISVETNQLLTGHVELKAPGTGADARRFRGRNKEQWKKFASLPNLIYTDGNEWILYRDGERKGRVSLPGDVRNDGPGAVDQDAANALSALLRDFFSWNPIVPRNPKRLAEMLAPLCHLLRDDVLEALHDPDSGVSELAREWRAYLFPDADDAHFADAYAQTLTYALLLARYSGETNLSINSAANALQNRHNLLAQALRLLGDPQARDEIALGVDLLERSISAVDPAALTKKDADPWLYFYEDFLAAYDPKLRKDSGAYYTPVEIVRAQVRLVSDLLVNQLDKPRSFADDDIVVLDPAVGTGTYPLAALQYGFDVMEDRVGPGAVGATASKMARNIHAFESLVGPYAVAHLRLSERITAAEGSLPDDGVHVYLTDTLASPYAVPDQPPLVARALGQEQERALEVKREARVLVCIGNPPYDRQEIGPDDEGTERKGGWVRFGDGSGSNTTLFQDFLSPARESGASIHIKNLYNDYVYFWRWALWKVFEKQDGPGIISFITAASYLRGPGFVGVRETMRRAFDDLWIIDLEGGNLGARKTENVFNIQTPVAIAVGVRYGNPKPDEPARARYAKVEGTEAEKLAQLDNVSNFDDLMWRECPSEWHDFFLPTGEGVYFSWPLLTDIFPWQHSGVQLKRKWPIAEVPELLEERWGRLLEASDKGAAFKETGTRKVNGNYLDFSGRPPRLGSLASANASTPLPPAVRYAYRSFDRQWTFADTRFGDRVRPELWRAHSDKQVYLASLLTEVLGSGPAATVASDVPDLHYFSGRGGKDIVPLWRDARATAPNITQGLLDLLSEAYGEPVAPEDLFAYAYSLLASPAYVEKYWDELTIPGPRLPITREPELFRRGVELGRNLICLHTYGERCGVARAKDVVQRGKARYTKGIPDTPDKYPEDFSYDPETKTLHVGEGEFSPVEREVYEFEVSGLRVVGSWLAYRRKEGHGRRSSPLDDIRPTRWTEAMTDELLALLWMLEATIEKLPQLAELLEQVVDSDTFAAEELPLPSPEEHEAGNPDDIGNQSPELGE